MTYNKISPERGERERMLLAQITASYFCAGIVLRQNAVMSYRCVETAPILAFMLGWNAAQIKLYCDRKGWDVQRVAISG